MSINERPIDSSHSSERSTTRSRRVRRALGWSARAGSAIGLGAIGHFGGVIATNIAPAHIETRAYQADISLSPLRFNQIIGDTPIGEGQLNFNAPVPTPAIIIRPKAEPTIVETYAEKGIDGLSVSTQSLDTELEDARDQLIKRYLLGIVVAESLAMGLYVAGSKKVSPKTIALPLVAGALAIGYQGGGALTAYNPEHYDGHTETGLMGSLLKESSSMLKGLDKRSEQLQPYAKSWLALRKDVTQEIIPGTSDPITKGPRFMLISDVHAINMTDFVRQVAEDENVDAIIDTGDLFVSGYFQEGELTGLLRGIEAIGKPYIVGLGNHDKNSPTDTSAIDALKKIPNVIILQPDGDTFTVVHVGDLRIAGVNDFMRYYGDDNKDNKAKQQPVIAHFNQTFDENPPDIAISHEPNASKNLASRGIRLAGHMHADSTEDNDTYVLGTLTGGGIFGHSDSPELKEASNIQSYAILDFDAKCNPRTLTTTRFQNGFGANPAYTSITLQNISKKPQEAVDRDCTSDEIVPEEIAASTPQDTAASDQAPLTSR